MKGRRESLCLIAIAAFVVIAVATGDASAASEAHPLAVRVMSYGKFQEGAFAHLDSIGVKYVFMSVPSPDEADSVMQKLKEHGLKPVVLRGEADLSKPEAPEQLGVQAETCAKMGVTFMFISAKRNDAPKEAVFDRLRQAGERARKAGVTITLETHPDLGTNGDIQVETMKAINHPNIRVNFDTANITYYNKNTDAAAELKKSIDYVATVEFKDHNAEFETWNFPVLGQGKVNFPEILSLLKEHGYKGAITIEFEGVKGVELNEEQTRKAIADCVTYVRSIGSFE